MSVDASLQTFLGFDYGLKRIGVAVGQRLTRTAQALEVVQNQGQGHFERIEQLINQWQPHALVVGIPLTEDGTKQPMTTHARRFARELESRYGLPVLHADERYSSREAQQRFVVQRALGGARRKAAGKEDAVAAEIILRNWLETE